MNRWLWTMTIAAVTAGTIWAQDAGTEEELPGGMGEADAGLLTEPLPPLVPPPDDPFAEVETLAGQEPAAALEDEGIAWQDRVKFRQIRAELEQQPDLVALWQEAETARYDSVKRRALQKYYTELFARVRKKDSGLEKLVASIEEKTMPRIQQTRIEASVPPDEVVAGAAPAPAAAAAAAPVAPAASPKPAAKPAPSPAPTR
jgi:hypothetical protein